MPIRYPRGSKRYRNEVLNGRFGGPMICFLALIVMVVALISRDTESVWYRVAVAVVSYIVFRFSARFTRASWKKPLK